MNRWLYSLILSILVFSCIEDRIFPNPGIENPKPEPGKYGINSVFINEFIASACKSSEVSNGSCLGIISSFYSPTESRNGKWVELYNPADTTINLGSGQWFITDDTSAKDKFRIPKGTFIPSKNFLVVCCDNSPNLPADRQLHANFSLGRYSGDVAVYYKTASGSDSIFVKVNEIQYVSGCAQVPAYDSTARHISYGRQPNGNGGPFSRLSTATPGKSNN